MQNEKINAMNLTTEMVPVYLASSLLLKSSLPRLSVFIRLLGWPVHRTTETNIAPVRMHFFFSCWLLWHLGSSSFIRQGKLKTGTSKRESVIGAGVPPIVITTREVARKDEVMQMWKSRSDLWYGQGGRDVKFRREATLVVGNEVFKKGELVSGGGAYVLDH